MEPADRLGPVLPDPIALRVHLAQMKLRLVVAALRGRPEPACRLDGVPLHSFSGEEEHAQEELGHRVVLLGRLAIPGGGAGRVPRDSLACVEEHPEEEARKERLAALERRRRSRAGTIATSERGLLRPPVEGKRLLGA